MVKTIEEAVEQLKRDPTRPVRARVGDLTIEEVLAILAEARHRGGQRPVPDL